MVILITFNSIGKHDTQLINYCVDKNIIHGKLAALVQAIKMSNQNSLYGENYQTGLLDAYSAESVFLLFETTLFQLLE